MSLASEWATSQRAVGGARPKFIRSRLHWPGAVPCEVVLAQVADNGDLQVLAPILPEELAVFVAWLRETWAP